MPSAGTGLDLISKFHAGCKHSSRPAEHSPLMRARSSQVVVYSVAAIQPDKKSINLTGKHWMLEATADAAAERQVEVAKQMGSFAERLLPHVELKKPL